MSVQDLIWVNVCQAVRIQKRNDFEKEKQKANQENIEAVYNMLSDIRHVALDTNMFVRANVFKSSKKRPPLFDVSTLPSAFHAKKILEKKEEENLKQMSEYERQVYLFEHGKKVIL